MAALSLRVRLGFSHGSVGFSGSGIWILDTSFWVDGGTWLDSATWND